jgi:aryl-alcohol dehydrogenase-like predicted oxidoreductase
MQYRELGRSRLEVSVLGFGCGAVGGLMVKGERQDMVDAVARAIESGVTYFDTARAYGNGQSEISLGHVLKALGADVVIGTKVDLQAHEMADIERSIITSVEGSLRRLQRDRVDLIQLHNVVRHTRRADSGWLTPADVATGLNAFEKLKQQGKVRAYGINGLGETSALLEAIELGQATTIQSCFNLINPTAGLPTPEGFPFQDYEQLIDKAATQQMGVIAIRVLAAGALSGSPDRTANAAPRVTPIGTAATYAEDVALAQQFSILVDAGYVGSLVEAAIRFAISKPEVSTAMVGISNTTQLEEAVIYANRGPLPSEAMDCLPGIWASLSEGLDNTAEASGGQR